ncbi:phage major capsid protein [Sphingomicrobium arenosum]|uniref:phage major capsid protein n=1 Tax=Sphingomicrobium arenosum TaxID=2233861 RepID=UPI00223F890F|nr:phage major capsid protein [Sphingomicrobium arenosum]
METKMAGTAGSDMLEQSFDMDNGAELTAMKEELAVLKRKVGQQAMREGHPTLDGVKEAGRDKKFADAYLRRGDVAGLEAKSIESNDALGGYAIPQEIDGVIDNTLLASSPIRQIANVVKVGSAGYRKLVASGGTPSGWASFEGARGETTTPTFHEIVPASGELFANPAATQQMLDDAAFDVESWLAGEIATEFARAEGAAFVNGTGASQPLGFLSSPVSANGDDSRAMGTLQTIGTGSAGAFPSSDPADVLLDLVQSLRQPYRQGAVFVMNSATAAAIRKFKTADGAYIWQPGLAAGTPSSLLGYPVVEAGDMPDMAAGSLSVAFGNFKAGYTIADRGETVVLRDPYTNKPFVHFYATRRVGGQVTNSESIKLLEFA